MTPRKVKTNIVPFCTIIKRAFHKGMMWQDLFFDYISERIMVKRPWLSNDEITRLMKVYTKYTTWNFTRDMFYFLTFTSITFVDLENLKHTNIQTMEDGILWIVLNRQKKGTASYIPLLDIPKQILERYKDSEFAKMNRRVFKLQHHVCVNWLL